MATPEMEQYWARATKIVERHDAQTADTVAALRARYEAPVFGHVRVWDLLERLAQCIDPSDGRLFGASQLVHVLQMLEAMLADGVDDPDLFLAAFVHDLGKTLLLTDEDPANIVCMTAPIGTHEPGVGLDNVLLQWNHDEFGWSRLRDIVPEHIAWLVRYHSIDEAACVPLMDDRDRDYYERYWKPFARYDHEFKSTFQLPASRLDDYRDLVEAAFPKPIAF